MYISNNGLCRRIMGFIDQKISAYIENNGLCRRTMYYCSEVKYKHVEQWLL